MDSAHEQTATRPIRIRRCGPCAPSSRTSSRWQLLCTHAATRATRTATSRPRLLSPRPALQRGQRRAGHASSLPGTRVAAVNASGVMRPTCPPNWWHLCPTSAASLRRPQTQRRERRGRATSPVARGCSGARRKCPAHASRDSAR